MSSNLGLCGPHRTGKTTTAIALSQKLGIPFISINASDVFLKYGFHPSDKIDLRNRLFLQQKILEKAEIIWSMAGVPSFICDRTPIDMWAYLMADINNGELDEHTQAEIMAYWSDCDRVTQQYFSKLVLIPPAIPFVQEQYKAALNEPLIHKLNCLILGKLWELGTTYQVLPKSCLEVCDRVDYIAGFWRQKID